MNVARWVVAGVIMASSSALAIGLKCDETVVAGERIGETPVRDDAIGEVRIEDRKTYCLLGVKLTKASRVTDVLAALPADCRKAESREGETFYRCPTRGITFSFVGATFSRIEVYPKVSPGDLWIDGVELRSPDGKKNVTVTHAGIFRGKTLMGHVVKNEIVDESKRVIFSVQPDGIVSSSLVTGGTMAFDSNDQLTLDGKPFVTIADNGTISINGRADSRGWVFEPVFKDRPSSRRTAALLALYSSKAPQKSAAVKRHGRQRHQ